MRQTARAAGILCLHAHAFRRRNLSCILPREKDLKGGTFQIRKTFLKDMQPKGMNRLKVAGVDEHFPKSSPTLFHRVEQFKSRCAVEIAGQLQVEAVTIPMDIDPEIGCHDGAPFSFALQLRAFLR